MWWSIIVPPAVKHSGYGHVLGSQSSWIHVPALPLNSHVTFGKWFYLVRTVAVIMVVAKIQSLNTREA